MKRAIILLTAAAMLAGLGACSFPVKKQEMPQAVPAVPAETVATQPPVPEKQPMEIYAPVIESYRAAANAKKSAETLMNEGLNYMAAYCYGDAPAERLGYCTYDLDSDGVPELFIGSKTGDSYQDKIVLEMYSISGGEAVRVFSSGERDRYYLCSDRRIANEASSSAFDSAFAVYTYSNGKLNESESVLFDMAANRENPWFLKTAEGKRNIGEDEANAKITEIESLYVTVDYTPLSK